MKIPYTLGEWCWQSFDGNRTVFLGTNDRGRLVVLDARNTGPGRAQIRLATKRTAQDLGGLMAPAAKMDLAAHGDAALLAGAPDHALLLAAMMRGLARVDIWVGRADACEVCVDGLRHACRIDLTGCPVLTTGARAALVKLLEATKGAS